jgi:2-succinyl-6-hydroxy-2,4-cyclohexadiene-1-carboxylate synthase
VLHLRRFGSGPEVVALHGFSLTGEQFSPGADLLNRAIVSPDLPGHGLSRSHPTDVDSVLAGVEAALVSPSAPRPLIGYSQGARVALLAAVEDPTEISALVLVSGTAGIEDLDERQARSEQDHDLAERIETLGLGSFIDSWTTAGTISLSHLTDEYRTWDRAIRSENSATGIASALRGYGQGGQPSVWDAIEFLPMPVLLVTGQNDKKYTSIGEQMADLIPDAELVVIDDAGHNPLADQPGAAYGVVSAFLDRNS